MVFKRMRLSDMAIDAHIFTSFEMIFKDMQSEVYPAKIRPISHAPDLEIQDKLWIKNLIIDTLIYG